MWSIDSRDHKQYLAQKKSWQRNSDPSNSVSSLFKWCYYEAEEHPALTCIVKHCGACSIQDENVCVCVRRSIIIINITVVTTMHIYEYNIWIEQLYHSEWCRHTDLCKTQEYPHLEALERGKCSLKMLEVKIDRHSGRSKQRLRQDVHGHHNTK